MDIEYLLLLQAFRNATNDLFTPLMESISLLAISFWPFAVAVSLYWCVSKKVGIFLLLNSSLGNIVNSTLKNTFCVYRPWIRDASIVPAGDAIHTATGYSFPSGHTQAATAYYGGGAWLLYKSKRFWLCAALIVLLLLTGFARNYLGVHTPKDVAVALCCTSCVVAFNLFILNWIEKKKNNDLIFFGIGMVVLAAFICYIRFKAYPTDYVDGKLLVDPTKMQRDSWGAAGMFAGLLCGWITERRFIRFSTKGNLWQKIMRTIIGLTPLYFIYNYCYGWLVESTGIPCARFLGMFIPYMIALTVYPWIVKKVRFL